MQSPLVSVIALLPEVACSVMVYLPPVFHPHNHGSDEVVKPVMFQYTWKPFLALVGGIVAASFYAPHLTWLFYVGIAALLFFWSRYWCWSAYLLPEALQSDWIARHNRWDKFENLKCDMSPWLIVKNPAFARFKNRKIPLFVFVEAYRRGDVAVPDDNLPRNFENLDEWSYTGMNWDYFHFLFFGYLLDISVHTRMQDTDQVQVIHLIPSIPHLQFLLAVLITFI